MERTLIMPEIEILQTAAKQLSIEITDNQLEQLITYKDLLKKWNKTFSLTAINKDNDILTYHILDAIAVLRYFESVNNILDVGSGMGIPAIILAIFFPQIKITALDSNSKKTAFLLQVKI
jgi:16S rRNA (guanine527-N7)-methyltransferase